MNKDNGTNSVNGDVSVVIPASMVDAMLAIGFAVILIAVAFTTAYVPLLFSLAMDGVAILLLSYLHGKLKGQPSFRLFLIACSLWLAFHSFVLIAECVHGKALPSLSLCLFLAALAALLCCNRLVWLGAFLFPSLPCPCGRAGVCWSASGWYTVLIALPAQRFALSSAVYARSAACSRGCG